MIKKILIITCLLGYSSLSLGTNLSTSQNLPEMCKELSSEVINLSNHQSDDTCQGTLGRTGVMINLAGTFLENNNPQGAKNNLAMADRYFGEAISFNCEYKEKILTLQQREKTIATQIS